MTTPDAAPTVSFSWSLDVECPQCKNEIDLVSYDAERDYLIGEKIFSNAWHLAEGTEVTCPHCDHEFKLGKVEY